MIISKKTIKYASQNIDNSDIFSVKKTLKEEFITQGPTGIKFEELIKKKFKSKYSLVTSSGTSALKIAVSCLNLKKKSIAIIPSNTFVATANAARLNDLKVVIAPVNELHGSLDFNCFISVIDLLKKKKIKPSLLINVFYAGQTWDVKKIYDFCKKEKIFIIEDACHAIGTKYIEEKKSFMVGSCKHADITTFSFHSIKNITTGEGGCILTNNKTLYNKSKILRSHGINKFSRHSLINKKNFSTAPWFYEAEYLSENYRLSDIQSSLGISQLKKINKFFQIKNKIYSYYLKKILRLSKYLVPLKSSINCQPHWHLFPVLLNKRYVKSKKKLFLYLKKHGIQCQVHYIPLYKHPIYKKKFHPKLHLSSENYYNRTISLPFHTNLKNSQIDFVLKKISFFFNNLV